MNSFTTPLLCFHSHILAPGIVPGTTSQGVETQRQRKEQGEEEGRRGEILLLIRAPSTPAARGSPTRQSFLSFKDQTEPGFLLLGSQSNKVFGDGGDVLHVPRPGREQPVTRGY